MSIIRAPRPESGYLTVRNDVVRDERLSYKAVGVLLTILSRPDNWRCSAESLARPGKEGREAVLNAFKELRAAGYMRQVKSRNSAGQITTLIYVFDTPESAQPESANPFPVPTRGNGVFALVAPETGQPEPVNPLPIEVPREERPEQPTTSSDAGAPDVQASSNGHLAVERDFENWYAEYPRHEGRGAAVRAYRAARKKTDAVTLLAGAQRMRRQFPKGSDLKYCAMPATWLNGERWADESTEPSEVPRDKQRSFTAPPPPDDMPTRLFGVWNLAHVTAWREDRPGPADWRELAEAN